MPLVHFLHWECFDPVSIFSLKEHRKFVLSSELFRHYPAQSPGSADRAAVFTCRHKSGFLFYGRFFCISDFHRFSDCNV
jgi:hypothetical protein